ncbi:(2Fe-2S)-binding protein [Ferriphaselus sp. R-1]|uniref:(2Fe-2S)-binding protein n=1 Tax=Ferriphaselus sp. R-1 TaxID=1485544 RepID=UPI000691BDCB|nr:(2Fe-2S)-binding protein [Ferriphaselus sp. R-1]
MCRRRALPASACPPWRAVMCSCSGTRRAYIQRLYQEEGMDLPAISRWTGALSGCGGCEWDIADFIKQLDAASGKEA